MLPDWSIAMLPIQRKFASGAYVPAWNRLGLLPASSRSSYQRTPTLVPAITEWFTTSAWWPSAKLRYASRYIRRSARESRLPPPLCGMQVPPPHASRVGRNRQRGRTRERGVRGRRPVDVELPGGERGAGRAEADHRVGCASGRQPRAVEIARQQAAEGVRRVEALLRRRRAGQHLRAIEGADLGAQKRGAGIVEQVVGDVVRIRPHAHLRVVGEPVGVGERVAAVGAGGIARSARRRRTAGTVAWSPGTARRSTDRRCGRRTRSGRRRCWSGTRRRTRTRAY